MCIVIMEISSFKARGYFRAIFECRCAQENDYELPGTHQVVRQILYLQPYHQCQHTETVLEVKRQMRLFTFNPCDLRSNNVQGVLETSDQFFLFRPLSRDKIFCSIRTTVRGEDQSFHLSVYVGCEWPVTGWLYRFWYNQLHFHVFGLSTPYEDLNYMS